MDLQRVDDAVNKRIRAMLKRVDEAQQADSWLVR